MAYWALLSDYKWRIIRRFSQHVQAAQPASWAQPTSRVSGLEPTYQAQPTNRATGLKLTWLAKST
jgi:hypothetical protein